MSPIKQPYKIGYRHGQKTFYNSSHIGVDIIVPEMTPVYAPDDGKCNTFFGTQGGQWLSLQGKDRKHRFAHIKQYNVTKGQQVKRGDIIAYSGGKKGAVYSGNSTNPHVHWDVEVDGRYIDPLQIVWDNTPMPTEQETIRQLNEEIGRVTAERDKAITDLKAEQMARTEETNEKLKNYEKWQQELDLRKKLEALITGASEKIQKIKEIVG